MRWVMVAGMLTVCLFGLLVVRCYVSQVGMVNVGAAYLVRRVLGGLILSSQYRLPPL